LEGILGTNEEVEYILEVKGVKKEKGVKKKKGAKKEKSLKKEKVRETKEFTCSTHLVTTTDPLIMYFCEVTDQYLECTKINAEITVREKTGP
jgi:hypothetical protein